MAKQPQKPKEPEAPAELDEIMRTILKAPPKHKTAEKPKGEPAKRAPTK